jgi:putative transposase
MELLEDSYTNIKQARSSVAKAINTYNLVRLHSSVDMLTPEQAHLKTGKLRRRWGKVLKAVAKQPAADVAD